MKLSLLELTLSVNYKDSYMAFETPMDTISRLLAARSNADINAALDCYEHNASVVTEDGRVAQGSDAIKVFTEATIALPITLGARSIVEGDGIALHVSQWTIRAAGSAEISGRTADVLRRQPDGRWLLTIDNPLGTALLDETEKYTYEGFTSEEIDSIQVEVKPGDDCK